MMKKNEEQKKGSLEQQLAATQAALIQQKKNQQSSENPSDEMKLQNEVNQLKDSTVSTTTIIDQLTKMLPMYGVFQSLNYESGGTITLQVRFNDKRESIYYFARMQKQNWIEQVNLSSIEAEEVSNTEQTSKGQEVSGYIANYQIQVNKEKVRKLEGDAK
jgi:Tfp pilus assembly protein PilN